MDPLKWIEVPLVERELLLVHLLECASTMFKRAQAANRFTLTQAFQRQNLAYEAYRAAAQNLGCPGFPEEPSFPSWSASDQAMKELVIMQLQDWQMIWLTSNQEATEAGFTSRAERCACMIKAISSALRELGAY